MLHGYGVYGCMVVGAPSRSHGHKSMQRADGHLILSTDHCTQAKAEQRARSKERVPLPDGWATAVAAEALRDFKGRKFCAVDWFTSFSAHPLAKKSSERFEAARHRTERFSYVPPSTL